MSDLLQPPTDPRALEALRLLGALVARAGGEIRIGPDELAVDRILTHNRVGMTGVVVLRVEKP